jgi:chromosome segregation ATPase
VLDPATYKQQHDSLTQEVAHYRGLVEEQSALVDRHGSHIKVLKAKIAELDGRIEKCQASIKTYTQKCSQGRTALRTAKHEREDFGERIGAARQFTQKLSLFNDTVRVIKNNLPDFQDALYGQPYKSADAKLSDSITKAEQTLSKDKGRLSDLEGEQTGLKNSRREKESELSQHQSKYAEATQNQARYQSSLDAAQTKLKALEQAQVG